MACAPPADREGAVREVAHVYERIKIQQPLLLHHHHSSAQLAHTLLGDALRALNVALSVIKQQPPTSGVKAELPPHHLSPHIGGGSPASADSETAAAAVARRAGKRRRSSASSVMEAAASAAAGKKSKSPPPPSWVDVTPMPYEDGFQWRKYGEKKINGTNYSRSYFRCTYKDETGCLATKHVQQTGNCSSSSNGHHQHMPMFQVTYSNHHTCSNGHAAAAAAAAAAAVVKQEEPPVVLEISRPATAIPFHQPPPLIPVGVQMQQFGGTATTVTRDDDSHGGGGAPSTASSSCISGESSYDYSPDDMAADAFYDLDELLLLCDSFKDY